MTHDHINRFIEVYNNPFSIDNWHCGNTPPGEFVNDIENGSSHCCCRQGPERWRTLWCVLGICNIGPDSQFAKGKMELNDFLGTLR